MSDESTPQAAPPPEPTPLHSSRKKLILGGVGIVAVIVIALSLIRPGGPSTGVGSPGGPTETLTGEFNLTGGSESVHIIPAFGGQEKDCVGVGPFEGFVQGFGVSVLDTDGNEIAAGSMKDGELEGGGPDSNTCVVPFDVPNLPPTDVYIIKLTSGEDELARFTAEELEELDWQVEIPVAP